MTPRTLSFERQHLHVRREKTPEPFIKVVAHACAIERLCVLGRRHHDPRQRARAWGQPLHYLPDQAMRSERGTVMIARRPSMLGTEQGWTMAPDGAQFRRVLASPDRKSVV